MTIIGNNNANNPSSLANSSVVGSKDLGGSVVATSFMDIISMLSLNSELNPIETKYSELLINDPESKSVSPNLALLKQFLTDNDISSKTLVDDQNNGIASNDTAAKFLSMLQKINSLGIENLKDADTGLDVDNLPADKILLGIANMNVKAPFREIKDIVESGFEIEHMEDNFQIHNNFNLQKVPQISQFMINSSILKETPPKTLVIDLENIVREVPNSFNELNLGSTNLL